MAEKNKIIEIIYSTIDEVNSELPSEKKIQKSLNAVLYGGSNNLDSLDLVDFIVLIEQKIEDELKVTIDLTDDRAMSQKQSPFRTIGSLVDYINEII